MFTMYQEMVTGPGSLENEAPFIAYLDGAEPSATTGDVEAPNGHVRLYGRHILTTDSNGFVYGHTFPNRHLASIAFDAFDADYCAWCADDDCPCTGELSSQQFHHARNVDDCECECHGKASL